MLCVYESTDVCTFLREVLCSAGYNALTTLSIDDARILLKATKAKLVVVSSRMQSVHGKPIRKILDEIDPSRLSPHFGRELCHPGSGRGGREIAQQRWQPVGSFELMTRFQAFLISRATSPPQVMTLLSPRLCPLGFFASLPGHRQNKLSYWKSVLNPMEKAFGTCPRTHSCR